MNSIKPNRLQSGDTIALLSPSWGGPGTFPHVYELGKKRLQDLGLKIKEYPTTCASAEHNYAHPEKRAADFMDAIANTDVKGIIASIGGNDSIRLLPYLDSTIIQQNPKFIMGYSDTTTLLTYCNLQGIVTFQGPSVMAGFAEQGRQREDFEKHVRDFLFEDWDSYTYTPYNEYTEELLPWDEPNNLLKQRQFQKAEPWRVLQGAKKSAGTLFGGNIEVLEFLKGTTFWPTEDFWDGKILFFETSEEVPSIQQVQYWLRNYGIQGIFEKINGILFGRPRGYSHKQKKELDEAVIQIVHGEFGATFPVVSNMHFGHTDPQHIIPLGVKAEIDPTKNTVTLTESPFK